MVVNNMVQPIQNQTVKPAAAAAGKAPSQVNAAPAAHGNSPSVSLEPCEFGALVSHISASLNMAETPNIINNAGRVGKCVTMGTGNTDPGGWKGDDLHALPAADRLTFP